MRAALIVNPGASRVTPALVAAVEAELRPRETLYTERPGHGAELAREACRGCERLYVFSGDGGFNEVVNGVDGRVAVGFLPGGATSVLPRALGLPRDALACARRLARSQRIRRISLGRANGRRFAFAAGVGLVAEVVRAVNERGRRGGRRRGDLAYLSALFRLLAARGGAAEPAMTVRGRRVAFAAVANGDPYSYFGPLAVRAAPGARFELGLDLVAPARLGLTDLPSLACSLVVRPTHPRWPRFLYVHDADEIRLECDRAAALQVDGEDLGDVREACFEAEREALRVIV